MYSSLNHKQSPLLIMRFDHIDNSSILFTSREKYLPMYTRHEARIPWLLHLISVHRCLYCVYKIIMAWRLGIWCLLTNQNQIHFERTISHWWQLINLIKPLDYFLSAKIRSGLKSMMLFTKLCSNSMFINSKAVY